MYPCREGTGWMFRMMQKLVRGEVSPEQIELLENVTKQVEGHTICALGDAAAWPIQGLIKNFKSELIKNYKKKIKSIMSEENLINIKINHKDLQVDKNLTVMQACEIAGEEIPRFCYHDKLSIAGNCRMCLVEIEKAPKLASSAQCL